MLTVRGRHYRTSKLCSFHLVDGRVEKVTDPGRAGRVLGGDDYWIAPGLVDIQVNGYQGHDFLSGETTAEDVVAVAMSLANAGVTAFCPTVTTNSYAAMEVGLRAIARACDSSDVARERIVGVHLEGPYICRDDGPRGAHPASFVHDPDWDEFTRLQDASGQRIRIVTLAPELPGAVEFIEKAVRAGIIVALGHHAATRGQINAAVSAGAVLSTHLGNGSHSQLPRHPNYIWEQLAHDGLMASMIVDGHHLPSAVVKSFYRVKGPGRLILISDAIWLAGLNEGLYQLMGQDVELTADRSVRLAGTSYLAGSTLRLCDAVRNVIDFAGASFSDAILMAAVNPAHLLGIEGAGTFLEAGARADLAVFCSAERQFELAFTIAGGEICYEA